MQEPNEVGDTSIALTSEHASRPAQVDFFSGFDARPLKQLAKDLTEVAVPDGAVVCREGERADAILARGTSDAYLISHMGDRQTKLRTMGPGEYFGEMGLLTKKPRSATVRAEGEAVVLKLERARSLQLLQEQPSVALRVTTTLTERLKTVSLDIADSFGWSVICGAPTRNWRPRRSRSRISKGASRSSCPRSRTNRAPPSQP
jgi:CRP-like cAMP-binding protein